MRDLNILKGKNDRLWKQEETVILTKSIFDVISVLDKHSIYHCSIREENVIITSEEKIKFFDLNSLVIDKKNYLEEGFL